LQWDASFFKKLLTKTICGIRLFVVGKSGHEADKKNLMESIMSKKLKLTLDEIKVSSFVTTLDKIDSKKANGGETEGVLCNSNFTCNFKCGETAYWECGNTSFCTNTCTWPKCY
jgi:hypothetical protein